MSKTYVGHRVGSFDLPQFITTFQPIVNVPNRSIVAYEALTRGTSGQCYPDLVAHLNVKALRVFHRRTAEAAVRRAAELGLGDMNASLCINVQPDLHPDALDAEFILQAAHRHGLQPSNILLEFTEDHRLPLPEYKRLLARNKDAGFATGIDDFGAGYSGLSALVESRPQVLKLDRALVRGIDISYTRQKLVSAFAECCHALDMKLIAEGIETQQECDMLLKLGISHMQGFLFSQPIADQLPVDTVWGVDGIPRMPKKGPKRSLLSALGLGAMIPQLTLRA